VKGAFAGIPPSMSPTHPDFVSVVNDRLRRIDANAVTAITIATTANSTPTPVPPGPIITGVYQGGPTEG
jgi:hypothetical protein